MTEDKVANELHTGHNEDENENDAEEEASEGYQLLEGDLSSSRCRKVQSLFSNHVLCSSLWTDENTYAYYECRISAHTWAWRQDSHPNLEQ